MSYRLRFDRPFLRSLEALPGDLRSIARKTIQALADNPRPAQAKELDEHPTYFRMWLPRNHRLVYQILDDDEIVELLYIGLKYTQLYDDLGLGRQQSGDTE
ncbi:MAG: type II toxin-antitoxin system RelE/ParE family toxin [Chloroflexaceae bacterium]|jgi:mRNA-degrading endonuclease RelE of RelBE toxin-antitoxin system|nr:type II toxin-antitoxin system RelE/ParE family toxin [Chloroflexaceae bacterium]